MVVLASNIAAQTARTEPSIRAQILKTSHTLVIQPQGAWTMEGEGDRPDIDLNANVDYTFTINAGEMRVESPSLKQAFPSVDKPLKFTTETSGPTIRVGPRSDKLSVYPGTIEIHATLDSFNVVATIPLEQYLRGVVPSEIGGGAPAQAMSAQAVAARSFAILAVQNPNHKEEGFDICSEVHCQAYSGLSKANAACDQAVSNTRGTILTFKGKPIPAFYSSMCAGHTEDIRNIWPDRSKESAYHNTARFDGPGVLMLDLSDDADFEKALAARPAAYCNPAAHNVLAWAGQNFRWTREFTAEEVTSFVTKRKDIGRVTSIKTGKRGESGRLTEVQFVGDNGTETVNPEIVIRRLFEPALRSGAFRVETKGPAERPTHFVLSGGGSGHGVGMCQTGAMGMANAGKNYRDILNHYYSTADLEKLYD